jgi:hypothetical protein
LRMSGGRASREAGVCVGRSATRNRRPPTSHSLRISLFEIQVRIQWTVSKRK